MMFGRWTKTSLLVAAAFAGGAATAQVASATTGSSSPYAPFDQLARVLVLVENNYVDPADRQRIIQGAIKGMVAELDPHSAYMPAQEFSVFEGDTQGKFGGIGVEVDYRDDYVTVLAPIEGSPAARAGVRSGDQIIAVDGRSTRGQQVDELVTMMRGVIGSKVHITLRRPGVSEPLEIDLTREEIRVQSISAKPLIENFGYLRIKQFQVGTHEEMLRGIGTLRGASKSALRGVVLDLRDNPGGLVDEAEAVADELLDSGLVYTTRHRGEVIDRVSARPGGALASVPVVVLVNEYSASSAELVAGALQDSRGATLVGRPTFGKGSVQTIFDLPGGSGLRLTTMRYYTPSGRSIQASGIAPDVLIEDPKTAATRSPIREGDLEGHLPAEAGQAARSKPQRVVTAPEAPARGAPGEREVPFDPSSGSDFELATAFRLLRESTGGKQP